MTPWSLLYDELNMDNYEHTEEYYDRDRNRSPHVPVPQKNLHFKYNEEEILSDIREYVSSTYNSHYTSSEPGYKDIQTLDLMAAKELASNFCQANILKYGSRYGSKAGKNKKDLMKVIHYAMLLMHFDDHYKTTNGTPYETF